MRLVAAGAAPPSGADHDCRADHDRALRRPAHASRGRGDHRRYAATIGPNDFTPVEALLGEDGKWVAIDGSIYDRSTIAEFLGRWSHITHMVRNDRMAESLLGIGYQLTEQMHPPK